MARHLVASRVYDIDGDGYISNRELFQVLKMMFGNNLKDLQLQQIVDKTIFFHDNQGDARILFQEFPKRRSNDHMSLLETFLKRPSMEMTSSLCFICCYHSVP
ncbi:unnamed protein product [Cylicocyclus nassatus]|uniref:EF-hand domain-containing protein n=1 Tax=Cylicocyclus nassatus TaxID=53992 RepID=A0AA36MD21_CYLNA|nr:unnamed protein product [Cylicocyclus nassatus]